MTDIKTTLVATYNTVKDDEPSLPAQARRHASSAIAELVRIIENTKSDEARLAAIAILLDRGLGKPPASIEIALKDRVKPPSEEDLKRYVEEYRRFRAEINAMTFGQKSDGER